VVDSPGDNLLAEFPSVVQAVQCAVAVQQELKARNAALPAQRRMEFRIGINLGDVVVDEERIYGDGVNITARLASLADGGGICIAGSVYEQVKTKLALGYEDLGAQTVKNIAEPVRVYRVQMEPGVAAQPRSRHKPIVAASRRRGALIAAALLVLLGGGVSLWQLVSRPLSPSPVLPESQPQRVRPGGGRPGGGSRPPEASARCRVGFLAAQGPVSRPGSFGAPALPPAARGTEVALAHGPRGGPGRPLGWV
jgi:Adenylate and Guanylate cyclase catalytic domain